MQLLLDTTRLLPPPLQLLLDYRCYVEGGRIGTKYPFPKIEACLKRIAGMKVSQVQKHYGFAEEHPAINLRARAKGGSGRGEGWQSTCVPGPRVGQVGGGAAINLRARAKGGSGRGEGRQEARGQGWARQDGWKGMAGSRDGLARLCE